MWQDGCLEHHCNAEVNVLPELVKFITVHQTFTKETATAQSICMLSDYAMFKDTLATAAQ